MQYISTRNSKISYSFKEVFLNALSSDGGLYIPKKVPRYSSSELNKLKKLSYQNLASEIILKFCSDEFNEKEIKEIINKSYKNFRKKNVVNMLKCQNDYLLELFHGPTLAFKDIAMQIIGNMYEKILSKEKKHINIVVATSGDTGSAAIDAIKGRDNMNIFVLHPKNKTSDVQRKLMTTVKDKNVFNIAVNGNFDDCQNLVKLMFVDKDFKNSINMSGVNSINWARIISQIVYYFYSFFKIQKNNKKINFSVPTGNFGDIYAGYIAKKMGLQINKLIVATNQNDILKRAINNGIYKIENVVETISPSMDIQVASNFERLIFDICSNNSSHTTKLMNDLSKNGELKLENKELEKLRENFCSESLSEDETKLTIKEVYNNYKILIDPHTAIGVGAAKKKSLEGKTIILATAHPAKFSDVVMDSTGVKPELPESLKNILVEKESYEKLPKDLKKVQNFILSKI